MFEQDTNISFVVLDEICLEGLDGITCEALWKRLSQRLSVSLPPPEPFQNLVWNVICHLEDVSMFELAVARPELIIFDRYDYVDSDLGMIYEPEEVPENIYPLCAVDDTINKIRGSCETYYIRKRISNIVRKLKLKEVIEKWGNKLVLVGSQHARNKALLGPDYCPLIDLNITQYCLLERIGRSRYHGEVTQGKLSLQDFKIDSKTMFYFRNPLIKSKLITKQLHQQKYKGQNNSGSLLHLPRFYVERKPKACSLTEKVVEVLKSKHNHLAEYKEVKKELNANDSLKKLFKTSEFQRFVKTDCRVLYREAYPDASVEEWKHKSNDKEKHIRVIQLLNPDVNVSDSWAPEEEQEVPEELGLLDNSSERLDKSLMALAYTHVEAAGAQGISQVALGKKLGQPKLGARMVCKRLVQLKLVKSFMDDVGRQRVCRFVANKFSKDGKLASTFNRERDKMLELLKILTEASATSSIEKSTSSLEKSTSETKSSNKSVNASKSQVTAMDIVYIKRDPDDTSTNETESVVNTTKRDIDEIEIEYTDLKISSNLKGCNYGFLEVLRNSTNRKRETPMGVTHTVLRRANWILETVLENHVIHDLTKLSKMIRDKEENENVIGKIDKKSLLRILAKLSKDGFIKIIQVNLKAPKKSKNITFICEPNVTTDHTIIQSEIEQAKMKFFIIGRDSYQKMIVNACSTDKFTTDSVSKSLSELKSIQGGFRQKVFDAKMSKKYGYAPRNKRMKELHIFLFYIIYSHEGKTVATQDGFEVIRKSNIELTDDLKSEISTMYVPEVSWKMFIPPLPKHPGWDEGWTLMCDILLRLPLSVFVKIFNINYIIPRLDEYLDHPLKRHFLLKHLPSDIRNDLTFARRYIFSIHEVVMRLCCIGLLQFGPQKLKEKDQVFLYLNRHASLLDTRDSEPGYHKISEMAYPKLTYHFTNLEVVERYWYDIWNISVYTRLGSRNSVTGQNIILEDLFNKSEMLAAVKPRESKEAIDLDNGELPGDHRGACGFDSAMFIHIKRNWNWKIAPTISYGLDNKTEIENNNPANNDTLTVKKKIASVYKDLPSLKKVTAASLYDRPKRTKTVKASISNKGAAPVTVFKRNVGTGRKRIVRHVVPKNPIRNVRPTYDEIDMKALKNMSKLRVDWSPKEDKLLLLGKVALKYLFPNPRKNVISFTIFRDILHRATNSINKTSRACQRRILYVMKNSRTAESVILCLEEIKWCPDITRNFGEHFINQFKAETKTMEEYANKCTIHFVELVTVLRRKFFRLTCNIGYNETIPDSIEEFNKMYNVKKKTETTHTLQFSDPKCKADVEAAVVKTVLHSYMCSIKDKTRWSYQLFNICKQYPDQLLRNVNAKLRGGQMVSIKKQGSRKMIRTGNLPLSSAHFQLSITYENQMRTKYSMSLYRESFNILKTLVDSKINNKPEVHLKVTNGGTAIAIAENTIENKIMFRLEIPDQAVILDPRVDDFTDPTYDRVRKRYKDMLSNPPELTNIDSDEEDVEINNDTEKLVDKSLQSITVDDFSTNTRIAVYLMQQDMVGGGDTDNSKQHLHDYFVVNSSNVHIQLCSQYVDDLIRNTKAFQIGKMQASLDPANLRQSENILQSITSNIEIKSTYEPVTFCKQTLLETLKQSVHPSDEMYIETLVNHIKNCGEIGEKITIIGSTFEDMFFQKCKIDLAEAIRKLLDLRIIYKFGINTVHLVHYEYIDCWLVHTYRLTRLEREKLPITNSTTIKSKKRQKPKQNPELSSGDEEESCKSDRCKRQKVLNDSVDDISGNIKNQDKVKQKGKQNPELSTGEDEDINILDNSEKNSSNDNSDDMSKNTENQDIEMIDVNEERENHQETNYSTSISSNTEFSAELKGSNPGKPQEGISISIAPWIRIDGTLNRRVLDQWLGTILSFCISNPGVSMEKVQERFMFLLPIHTRTLLEILVKMECLTFTKIIRSTVNLFSLISETKSVPVTGFEDETEILIIPEMDPVVKFSLFLGERSYKTGFLKYV